MPPTLKTLLHATLAAVAISSSASAQTAASATSVVTVVRVAKPWYAPRFLVASRMRDSIPEYSSIPGLSYKVYTLAQADGRYGGIYLWTDRNAAAGWFNPAWFARVEKERGAPGEVRTFDALRVVDHTPGGTPADPRSTAVAAIVTLPGVGDPAERAAQLRATLPPTPGGLLREVAIGGKDLAGVMLLWRDAAAAAEGLGEGWLARAARALGVEPSIEWYDAPILLPSTLRENASAGR